MSHCAKCGAEVEQPATGGPKTYCGPTCRRAAEFELRRLQRRLEGAEQSVLVARRNVADRPSKYSRDRLAFEQQHLADLEERLRTLLADPDLKGEPK